MNIFHFRVSAKKLFIKSRSSEFVSAVNVAALVLEPITGPLVFLERAPVTGAIAVYRYRNVNINVTITIHDNDTMTIQKTSFAY